jgi:phage terminase large subunit GpA-like protein
MGTAAAELDLGSVLRAEAAERFTLPPKLTVSEWADAHRMLSREASAEPGRWRTDRAPYLRGIMDAFSEPGIDEVVFRKASQLGATEILNNVVGFYVDQDPSPLLVLQPNVEPMGKAWSTDRLAPMLRDTPVLQGKVRDPRSRDSGNTILHKEFPGGHITVAGANSAAGLASRPIRVVLCDEIDRYPASAGTEGDPIVLAEKRTSTFWNRKLGKFSSPTLKGASRIDHEFARGDRRYYHVPCPHCGEYQILRWKDEDGSYRLLFERDADGRVVEASVQYRCAHCAVLIDEMDKQWMLQQGRWIAEKPGGRVASFHLNALYSPWRLWPSIAQEFVDAKDNTELLQVFINTTLGEAWEELLERIDAAGLAARGVNEPGRVPRGAGVLTGYVDVQVDRLELVIRAWGVEQESWLVTHERLYGDPEKSEVWSRLDVLLANAWPHEAGGSLRVRAMLVDSGYLTEEVSDYVRTRASRGVHASRGLAGAGTPLVGRPGKPGKYGVRVFPIGVHTGKDLLFRRVRLPHPGPGYMHFCKPTQTGADAEYYAQFEAEKKKRRRTAGIWTTEYVQVRERNEAIDLEVGALAALYLLGPAIYQHLDQWVARAVRVGVTAQATEAAVPPPPLDVPKRPPPRRRPGGGWVDRWRRS